MHIRISPYGKSLDSSDRKPWSEDNDVQAIVPDISDCSMDTIGSRTLPVRRRFYVYLRAMRVELTAMEPQFCRPTFRVGGLGGPCRANTCHHLVITLPDDRRRRWCDQTNRRRTHWTNLLVLPRLARVSVG